MIRRTFAPVALAVVAISLALALAATPAAADTTIVSETLSEAKEVPPSGESGTGSGQVVLNADNTSAQVFLTFSGLASPVVAWHVHCGAAQGADAPIAFDPGSSTPTPPGGVKWVPTAPDVDNLKVGLCYFNVHSQNNPGGAIRGQLSIGVGGVAELAEAAGSPLATNSSSGGNAGLLAGVIAAVAAGAVALGGAAWYVRRRPA